MEFFRGKYMDFSAIQGVDLILLGGESSEWETLLDEWEQAESYLGRKSCYERSLELKNRVPIPPSLVYREAHLREQALAAIEALEKMDKWQDAALSKLEHGGERGDISLLSWGTAELKDICDKMVTEKPLWTDSQIGEVQPHYERARQAIILFFPEWIGVQAPRSDSPDHVGDFKHKMISLIGKNLKKLGLEEQFQALETHTLQAIRKAETIAEAHQLLRDVNSWLTTHGDAVRIIRIAKSEALLR